MTSRDAVLLQSETLSDLDAGAALPSKASVMKKSHTVEGRIGDAFVHEGQVITVKRSISGNKLHSNRVESAGFNGDVHSKEKSPMTAAYAAEAADRIVSKTCNDVIAEARCHTRKPLNDETKLQRYGGGVDDVTKRHPLEMGSGQTTSTKDVARNNDKGLRDKSNGQLSNKRTIKTMLRSHQTRLAAFPSDQQALNAKTTPEETCTDGRHVTLHVSLTSANISSPSSDGELGAEGNGETSDSGFEEVRLKQAADDEDDGGFGDHKPRKKRKS